MNELSRRDFVAGLAKGFLGVNAIFGAKDLLALNTPDVIPSAKSVIFL